MNIIDFTREYMHKNFPISHDYKFRVHPQGNRHGNGFLHFTDDLTILEIEIYNNQPVQFQAQTFIHEYFHITQLERHGFDEQITNRMKYENETEEFCRNEMPKVLRLYNKKFGTKLSVSTQALIDFYRKAA